MTRPPAAPPGLRHLAGLHLGAMGTQPPHAPGERRSTVWLADDSPTQRAAAAAALAPEYDVRSFSGAAPVLEALESARPDVLVLDWHMPELTGLEACSYVRERVDGAQLPILILTASSDRESLLTAFAAGANDFVRKPCDVDELRARVDALVRTKLLHDRVGAAEAQLQAEAHLREHFLAVLAHDLRQPINVVTMAMPLLAEAEASAGLRTALAARVSGAAARMTRMVSELLEFARSRAEDGVPLTTTPADLVSVVRRIVEEVRVGHPDATIELVTPEAEHGVWDVDRLAQVVSNLLENAIHHGGQGGVVAVRVLGDPDTVTLVVSNPGTITGDPRRLFRAFTQEEGATRRGLGLGLYIVEQVARAHGGTASAESHGGQVHFTVRVPRICAA